MCVLVLPASVSVSDTVSVSLCVSVCVSPSCHFVCVQTMRALVLYDTCVVDLSACDVCYLNAVNVSPPPK